MSKVEALVARLLVSTAPSGATAICWSKAGGHRNAGPLAVDAPQGVLLEPLEAGDFVFARPLLVRADWRSGERLVRARTALTSGPAESLALELEWALGNPRGRLSAEVTSRGLAPVAAEGNLFARTGLAARSHGPAARQVAGFLFGGQAMGGRVCAKLLALSGQVPGVARYIADQVALLNGAALADDDLASAVWQRLSTATPAYKWVASAAALLVEDAGRALQCFPAADCESIRYYAEPGTVGDDRRQAAGSYPLLAEMFARRSKFRAAIDSRAPLQPLLKDELGLSKGALKRLGKIVDEEADEELNPRSRVEVAEDQIGVQRVRAHLVAPEVRLGRTLSLLGTLPAEWVPGDQPEWRAFRTLTAGMAPIADLLHVDPAEALGGAKGRWQAFLDRLARAADCDPAAFDKQAMIFAISDLLEAADQLGAQVLLPAAHQAACAVVGDVPDVVSDEMRAAALTAAGGCLLTGGLQVGFQRVRSWMSRLGAIGALVTGADAVDDGRMDGSAEFRALRDASAWPVPTPLWGAPNGLVVRPLSSQQELQEESARLGHCVNSYWRRASLGETHIYSIQSADLRTSFSTFEVSPFAPERVIFRIVQHQGHVRHGRRVPREAEEAYAAFLDAVRSGAVPVAADRLAAWAIWMGGDPPADRAPRRRSDAIVLKSISGYAADRRDVTEALMAEWKGILGIGASNVPSTTMDGAVRRVLKVVSRHAFFQAEAAAPQL